MQVNALEGDRVRLIPLDKGYIESLYQAVDSPDIWTYLPSRMRSIVDMAAHVDEALHERDEGNEIPFVVFDKLKSRVVGMTRLEEVRLENRSVEIGWTWYATSAWRTYVNTEAKYLLLTYCFDVLNLVRVQFRVDSRNIRSQQAVLRLGATREGIFRKNYLLYDGYIRDTVFYSIVDDEWPTVRQRLEGWL